MPSNIEVQTSSLRRVPEEIRRFGEFCRSRGIDAIHTHMSSAHAFGALLRMFYRVPCVATTHSLNYQLHWFVNDRVICHNEESMRFMHNWNRVARRKLRQVPAFVDESYLEPAAEAPASTRCRLGIAKDRLMLVTIGNVERRKGVHDIVEAMPQVLQAGLDVCLLVAGWFHSTGYRAEIEERARLTGELVPPGKPAALGEAIVRALRDPERRRGMGREGRKRFASQFSAEVNIPKIEAILAEAAGRA